jgi:FkbM family methyltransferase
VLLKTIVERLSRREAYKRIRRGKPIVQTRFLDCELLVRAHEEVGRNIVVGDFEFDDLRHFLDHVRDQDLVFDIGANVGAYCVPIGRRFPQARVVSFEPIPLNAALIEVSILANRISNVEVVRACVTDAPGSVEFSVSEDSAYSSMIATQRKAEAGRLVCRAVSLDDYVHERALPAPDVVKIDVEGAELKVLQGAVQLFSGADASPRFVMIELFDKNLQAFGTSITEVVAWMTQRRYRPYVLIEGRKAPFELSHHNVHYNVFFER